MLQPNTNKNALRRKLLADRQAIASEVRQEWDAAIGMRLFSWWNVNPCQTLGIYWPMRGEPDLRNVYEELAERGVQLALPIVENKTSPLTFASWAPGDKLVKDALGVMVPEKRSACLHPDGVLVPCVGFNAANYRLGYGGGFYDRTLAVAPRPLAVGIAYQCCLADFAADAHDIPLDDIITEHSPAEFAPVSL
jgi:5,10-methenyltetrahydrofolate synthetase